MGSEESKKADRIEINLSSDNKFALGILLHIAHYALIKGDPACLVYNRKPMSDQVPVEFVERVVEVRQNVINRLLDNAYFYLDRCRLTGE
ncbi:hypothetical protein TI39_contig4258g00009 [Zymoseptoria brevis]|uniref:Uncharacterized protein n=1 Tax=Zymoseptoria brevis TaxID=1047168 RepID=A0A0F4G8T7_9PEZI|nr:hypothetical protein TI39_contig4258g00009 [Zymoseptoria brevis]